MNVTINMTTIMMIIVEVEVMVVIVELEVVLVVLVEFEGGDVKFRDGGGDYNYHHYCHYYY